MRDNQKYYYLRLKESYFEQESIVLLESMQDGILYSNILLKLYLKSLKHGGRLQLDEDTPYTAQMIATITRHQVGTVERALQIFLKLGLIEMLENGVLYMSNIELLIGQSSTEGERKRKARQQATLVLPCVDENGQMSKRKADICPQKRKEPSNVYGRYQNVMMANQELDELKTDYPAEFEDYIERLSQYMASSGKSYQNHAATIRYWITTDRAKEQKKKGGSIPDYSFKEGESL